jgi:formate hydrogenlyase subunit 6/NADH:ubiquinone oxidoreductase subunit I
LFEVVLETIDEKAAMPARLVSAQSSNTLSRRFKGEHIDKRKCVGCANCVPVCPMGAIYIGYD